MKTVLCFGEALVDIFTTGHHVEERLQLPNYRQYPGGAPANAAVAVAKLGGQAKFIGQVGGDAFGKFLIDALQSYNVDTSLMAVSDDAQTALAFVCLDHAGDRSFYFYRNKTADLLFEQDQIDTSWFDENSILHFCSNTLTDKDIANTTETIVTTATNAGSVVSFDVNLRHNLWPGKMVNIDQVNCLVDRAHILKFTREELMYLARSSEQAYLTTLLENNGRLILVTDGEHPVSYHTEDYHGTITPPTVTAVDTTAGGDAFIGSFLFGLSRMKSLDALLSQQKLLEALLSFCVQCGTYTVSRHGAFTALPEFEDVQQHWSEI